jgi:hypothetical protein
MDYRSESEKGEYFGKFQGGAIEIKNELPWDYRSRDEKGEYFGKFRGRAIEIKIRLPK